MNKDIRQPVVKDRKARREERCMQGRKEEVRTKEEGRKQDHIYQMAGKEEWWKQGIREREEGG